MNYIGSNIRRLRRAADMTQAQLGEKVGSATSQVVCNWEKGNTTPSLENTIALAKALGCTIDELVGDPNRQ